MGRWLQQAARFELTATVTEVADHSGAYYLYIFDRTMDQTTVTPPAGWTVAGKPLLTWQWISGTLAKGTTTPTMNQGLPWIVPGGTTIHTITGGAVEPGTGTTTEDS